MRLVFPLCFHIGRSSLVPVVYLEGVFKPSFVSCCQPCPTLDVVRLLFEVPPRLVSSLPWCVHLRYTQNETIQKKKS